jgi:hypothetical protein
MELLIIMVTHGLKKFLYDNLNMKYIFNVLQQLYCFLTFGKWKGPFYSKNQKYKKPKNWKTLIDILANKTYNID